jgi:hypothetical protein
MHKQAGECCQEHKLKCTAAAGLDEAALVRRIQAAKHVSKHYLYTFATSDAA